MRNGFPGIIGAADGTHNAIVAPSVGEECHEARTSTPSQSREENNNEPIVIVVPADAEGTYNKIISVIINENETEFDIDSLIEDEASQQLDLPLNAELISIDPYDTLNIISEETLQELRHIQIRALV
ncbi:hypothetical protein JTB14_007632 [Gonioctena quinquepunctata]|nr:hypothetical protein JTB14_007632 [Gonioctena quinquepunctata]